jgi:hypothetical protein
MSRSIVNVAETKSACKRLLVRLPDECESRNLSVVFTAGRDNVRIRIGRSSEIVSAVVVQSGKESVQCPPFSAMAPNPAVLSKEESLNGSFGQRVEN